jgi:prepilin-type processing-associated H-X9-DG protein
LSGVNKAPASRLREHGFGGQAEGGRYRERSRLEAGATMATPIDQRKKPTAVKIHVKTGAGVDIAWADGHASHFEFAYLREQCPCATCNDERGKKDAMASMNLPSSPLLPMYKPKPKAQAATQVGNYAIQISFSDGHSTGIFSYDYLRSQCPCEECAQAFRVPLAKS